MGMLDAWDVSCSIKLKHPLDKESWKVLEDAELDNTDHIYFTTPSGKRVDFIKADVLDKIGAEIEKKIVKRPWLDFEDRERDRNDAFMEVLNIIDKYKSESEE